MSKDELKGNEVGSTVIAEDSAGDDLSAAAEAQIALSRLLEARKFVSYDALRANEREIADLLVSSGAIRTVQNQEGFLFLTKPAGFLAFLRGQNGKLSILRRLATGRLFTGTL